MATVIPQVSIQDLVFNKSTPNTVGALQAGLNLSGTFQDQQKAKRQEQALLGQQQLGQEVASGLLSGQANPQGMAQLLASNPEMAAGILKQAGIVGQQGRDQLARTAFEIESIPAGSQRDAKIQEIGAQLQAQGADSGLALGLLGLSPEQQNKKLQSMQLSAMSPQQIQAIARDERNFGLEQQKFGLQQANVASQIGARSLTAGQKSEEFDIKRETLEIRREEQRQRALDRELSHETNQLKRDELQIKIDEKKTSIAQKKKDIVFTAESSIGSIGKAITTTEQLLKGDDLEKAAGVSSLFFTTPGSDAANFEATLETFKSQQFIQEVDKMRGLGALGEKEGERLIASAGSLNLSMSDKRLRKEIGDIQSTLKNAKLKMQKKFSGIIEAPKAETSITLESLTGDDILNMSTEELERLMGQ